MESEKEEGEVDLSVYDRECLKRGILITEVRGVKMPIWRAIESLLWVRDQHTHKIVKFRMRWAQKLIYKDLVEMKLNGKPMRMDLLKSRQLGASTVIAAIFFLEGMFNRHTRWCVMADIREHASNIFKMYQTFYNHLDDSLPNIEEIREYEHRTGKKHPDSIKPTLARSRAGTLMETLDNDSQIEVIVSGEGAGRSASYTGVHSSETAFQKGLDETNTALFSTVSILDEDSIIIIETTANGYNDYKKRWDRDSSGRTSFRAEFIPWFRDPQCRISLDGGMLPPMEDWIYRKWGKHPEVTREQILWYWTRYSEGYTEDKMKQEFPWDAGDAFMSSGKSVFSVEKLQMRKAELYGKNPAYKGTFDCMTETSTDGQTIRVTRKDFRISEGGEWKIYSKPEAGKHYVVICDPTKGMNYDYSAIQVIEQNTGIQCATYNEKTNLDDVARQIYCIACMYNNALVSSENNTGTLVLDLLLKMGYPSIYVEQNMSYEDINMGITRKYGHTTTRANRDAMIDSMVLAFSENPSMINDYETLLQMETFQIVQTKTGFKKEANGSNAHDDLVMAYVPFWTVRLQQSFDKETAKKPDGERRISNLDEAVDYLMRKRREEKSEKAKTNVFGFRW